MITARFPIVTTPALLTVAVLAAGCAPAAQETANRADQPPLIYAADGGLTLGFSQEGAESGWRAANTKSIQQAATDAGVDLKFNDSQGQVQNQIKALDTFRQQRLNVVAFSPREETGWEPVLRRLKASHIPVIASDRNVRVTDPSLQPVYIGSDLKEEGRRVGEWLAKKTDGKCNIVQLEGNIGGSATLDRTAGFAEAIASHPEMKIVVSRNGDFKRDLGKQRMEAILKSPEGQNVTAVYAENDDMALGAIQALQEAGKKPGTDVVVCSVDAIKDGLQAVIDGTLNCTVECSPLLGPTIMDVAQKLRNHESVPARIITKEELFDSPEQVKKVMDARKY